METEPHFKYSMYLQACKHATMEDEARERLCADPAGYRRAPSLITAETAAGWLRRAIHYENCRLITWIYANYSMHVPPQQNLVVTVCLEGRPAILRHLTKARYYPSVSWMIHTVVRRQSPQRVRQIFSAVVPQ